MGCHTWFYKDKILLNRQLELLNKKYMHELGKIYLEYEELMQLDFEIEGIRRKIETPYHDLFRTSKRNPDGSYINVLLFSFKDCLHFINDPNNKVTFKHTVWESDEQEELNKKKSMDLLREFWWNYPDGVIKFG